MTKSQAKILLEDLEYKKHYDANWDTECDCCGESINKGDDFVFMGDKQKICVQCIADMQDHLEEIAS